MKRPSAQQIAELDQRMFLRIFTLNGSMFLDKVMIWFSRSGDGYLYAPLGLCLLLADVPRSGLVVLSGIVAFTIELTVHHLLKNNIRRDRPFNQMLSVQCLLQPPDKFSFPSGHTAAAFLMAVLILKFFPFIAGLVFLWAAIVGFSRVYLGCHFPTDVIVGALLGALSALFGIWIIQELVG